MRHARRLEQHFLAILGGRGIRTRRTKTAAERYDGYTETWSNEAFPIGSLAEVYAVVGFVPEALAAYGDGKATGGFPEAA